MPKTIFLRQLICNRCYGCCRFMWNAKLGLDRNKFLERFPILDYQG